MFGILLVLPLLSQTRSSQAIIEANGARVWAQYASDAAAEYGLWKIEDSSFRVSVAAAGQQGLTVEVSQAVNGLQGSVRVVKVAREFDYTVWGNSDVCDTAMEFIGANNSIVGNTYSNRGIVLRGAGASIKGIVEYVTDLDVQEQQVTFEPAENNPRQTYAKDLPVLFQLSDYDDPLQEGTPAYQAQQEGKYHTVTGDWQVNESGTVFDGLYYVDGDLKLNGNDMSGTATFVVTGKIEVIGSGHSFQPYVDELTLFSTEDYGPSDRCKTPVIDIIGSGVNTLGGFVYAPYGQISIRGSGTLAGMLVGDSIDFSGSGLQLEPPTLPGIPEGCEAYDLIATADGVDTRVRVLYCGPGQVQILAWKVE